MDKPSKYKKISPEIGLLQYLGYTAGHSGLPDAERQEILAWIMESNLPLIHGKKYMDKWGLPKTRKRFNMILKSLTGFKNVRSKSGPEFDEAKRNWNDDIKYLDDEYFYRLKLVMFKYCVGRKIGSFQIYTSHYCPRKSIVDAFA